MNINPTQISFSHNGEEITGIASGTFLKWQFCSTTPSFIELIPSGIITPRIEFNGAKDPRYQLMESVLTALDKLVVEQA